MFSTQLLTITGLKNKSKKLQHFYGPAREAIQINAVRVFHCIIGLSASMPTEAREPEEKRAAGAGRGRSAVGIFPLALTHLPFSQSIRSFLYMYVEYR